MKSNRLVIALATIATGGVLVSGVLLNTRLNTQQQVISDLVNYNAELSKQTKDLSDQVKDLADDNKKLEQERDEFSKLLNQIRSEVHYNPDNLRQLSNATSYQVRRALKGTKLYPLSSIFVDLENTYKVNAFFLIAVTAHESEWGNSNRARTQNNLTGHAVYNNLSRGSSFSTKEEGLRLTAKLLSTDYLTEGGKYYRGLSAYDVNYNYCRYQDDSAPDYEWCKSVNSIAKRLVHKANTSKYTNKGGSDTLE